MTVCGKHGKTIKLFSHPSHSPWKSLRRFPHYHRHDYDEHEYLSKPVKTKTRRNDAQYHYPGGPNQMVKVGHAGIAVYFIQSQFCQLMGGRWSALDQHFHVLPVKYWEASVLRPKNVVMALPAQQRFFNV